MKRIKIVFGTASIVLFSFMAMLFSSCKEKAVKYNDTTLIRPCDGVICFNGATCSGGECVCPLGFEGKKCEIKWSDKFTGSYLATDDCYTGPNVTYDVVITPNPDYPYKMRLFNLGVVCPSKIVEAQINPEKTSFVIPLQNSCNNTYLSGYGNANGEFINIYLASRDTVLHTGTQCSIILAKKP